MDIAVVIPELRKYGGAERYLVECVARWKDRHDITIYTSAVERRLLAEHGIRGDVDVRPISPYFTGEHAVLLNGALLPKLWEQQIGRHDVYQTHLIPSHLIDLHPCVWFPHEPLRMLHDLRFQERRETGFELSGRWVHSYPQVEYTEIDVDYHEAHLGVLDAIEKVGRPDRIVANSRYTADYLERVFRRPVQDVVYPGVNVADFLPIDSHENVFVTIGQLWAHKRIELSIEAVALVEDVQLYVVGSGPEQERLEERAHELGVDDRVFFLTGLTNLELRILFSRCLGVVFMPIREPFGIVALEAMAAGKALIAADEGGYTEVVDETCAHLVPPRAGAIAEKMRHLVADKAAAHAMGSAGRERARRYTWDRAADELLAIVEQTRAEWVAEHPQTGRPAPERPLFAAQYFCWYGEGLGSDHWNDSELGGVTDTPVVGSYSSTDPQVIAGHLAQLRSAGFDVVIPNLHVDSHGVNEKEREAITRLAGLIAEGGSPLRLAVQICPYDCSPADLEAVIGWVRESLTGEPGYLRLDDAPVLSLFWNGSWDGDHERLEHLRGATRDFVLLGAMRRVWEARTEPRRTRGLFDGLFLFSPLEVAPEGEWEATWRRAYDEADTGRRNLRIVTASPGFDDRHLRDPARLGATRRHVERRDGAAYERTLHFIEALPTCPDLVVVSTFNEYHENTHIEPSERHGPAYLERTARFIRTRAGSW